MRLDFFAECLFIFRRHLVSLSLEAANCKPSEPSTDAGGNWRGLRICAREWTGEVSPAAYGNVQRGGRGHARSAANHCESIRAAWIWHTAREFWTGSPVGCVSFALATREIVGGWCGCRHDPGICRH